MKRSQLRSGRPAERNEWRKNDSGGESDISLTQHGSRSRVNRELSVFGVLLARENAQSRAAALTLFPPEQAVRVLGCWPEDEQADIILRLAGTGRIKDGVIALLEKQIEQEFQNVSGLSFAFVGTEKGVGGPSAAARILRCLDADTREKLFEKIEESGRGNRGFCAGSAPDRVFPVRKDFCGTKKYHGNGAFLSRTVYACGAFL